MTGVAAALLLFADGVVKALALPSETTPVSSSYVVELACTLKNGKEVARSIADGVIQTVPGVRYVIAVDTSGDAMQIGPTNLELLSKPKCEKLREGVCGFMEGSFIEVERNFQDRFKEDTGVLPSGSSAVICRDQRDWVWVFFVDNDELNDQNTKLKQWISDLLSLPM